jgi:hypothetical protein
VSTVARSAAKRQLLAWQLPVVFVFVTHILIPATLWRVPSERMMPGGWLGAALLVSELFALAFTSYVVAQRWSLERGVELGLIALSVFLCLPAAIVTYLGLAGALSLTNSLVATGSVEIALLIASAKKAVVFPLSVRNAPENADFSEAFLLILSFLAFGIIALNAVRYTPADSDSMWYHLPMVAEWIKTRSIAPVASISLMARGYPGAREAILAWLSLPMNSENVAFLYLLEVPATCLVLYAICREFEISATLSVAMAVLFLTTPEVPMWASSQKNDLFLTLVFLLVFFFMLRWLRTTSARYAVFAGLSAGLLCATKLSGPTYAGILAMLLVGAVVLRREPEKLPVSFSTAGIALAMMFALAAPWYIRNIAYFHNPFFPKEVIIFGKVLFAGPLDATFFAPITIGLHFPRLFANWEQFLEGLGVALPVLVAGPLLVFALFSWRNRCRIKTEALLWLGALPVLLLAVYTVQPFSLLSTGINSWQVQPRFLLPFAACLHITLSYLLSRVPGIARFALPCVGILAVWNLSLWTHFWWLLAVVALGGSIGFSMIAKRSSRAVDSRIGSGFGVRQFSTIAIVAAFIAAIVVVHWTDGFRERRKSSAEFGYIGAISPGWGQVSLYVRQNISNKRILCLGRPEYFPLYGRGYTNDLYSTDDRYAMEFLQKNRVDYIVGFRPFIRRGAEGQNWDYLPAATTALREQHPDKFQLVYAADGAEVVKVLEPKVVATAR